MADVNATQAQQMLGSHTSSMTDSGIPVEHLDYQYIGKCTNVKELEKIYKVLKSGKEGHYPDLIDFCEKRIADLNPKSKVLRKDAKPATEYDLGQEEWSKIKDDVKDWQNDINQKDEKLKTSKVETEGDELPPIRNRGSINTQGQKNQSSKQDWGKPSQERIKGSDFRKWDQYNAEAEAEKVDEKGDDEDLKTAAEKLAKSRSVGVKDAIDTSGMSVREKEHAANREKDKGNEAFRSSDYEEAIHYYSRSLSVVPSPPAFNNRSLARIKLGEFQGAIEDCSEVLELEPSNIKALLRRGTARKALKYYDLALNDLQAVIALEPNNKQALDLVSDIEKKHDETKEEGDVKEGSSKKAGKDILNGDAKTKPGGKRLVIEEVEGDECEEEEEEEEEEAEEGSGGEEKIEKAVREAVTEKLQGYQAGASLGMASGKTSDRSQAGTNGSPGKVDGASPARAGESGEGKQGVSETDGCIGSKPSPEPSAPVATEGQVVLKEPGVVAEQPQRPTPPPPLPAKVIAQKDTGNDLFRKGQYGEAHSCYSKAITQLESDKDGFAVPLAALYGNRASCSLRSGDPKSCIADCVAALELNPGNVKTYLKRAQAYETMEKYGHAYVDYKSAMNFQLYNANAQNGASRMADILKDLHGSQFRDKLPSQPKSPASVMPAYTGPNLVASAATTKTSSNQGSEPKSATGTAQTTNGATAQTTNHGVTTAAKAATTATTPPPSTAPMAASSSAQRSSKVSQASAPPPGSAMNDATPQKATNKTSASTAAKPVPDAPRDRKTPGVKPRAMTQEERFQEFKAKGNDQVKKGEYGNAVECYTCCIEVDPSQAVGYTNRALCYLKLNQPEEAIEDCNEALKRDAKGVKALYRRAQARRMVGQYQESARDLTELLKIAPTNAPAKKELDIVKDAWRKDLREKQLAKDSSQAAQEAGEKARERKEGGKKSGKKISIQEVNESEEEDSGDARSKLAANSKAPSQAQVKVKTKSSKGGQEKEAKSGKENKPASPSNSVSSPKKMTAYEFMHEWTSLKKKKNVDGYAALLRRVQPNDIPKVLSNKLDGDMLSKILNASANHLVDEDPMFTYQLLSKLRSVDRFKTISMFLTTMDKANVLRCINGISAKPDICKQDELKKLKKAYSL